MLSDRFPSLTAVVMLLGGATAALTTPALWTMPSGDLNWITGEKTLAYEKAFDEHLSIREASISFWANVQYFLFGEGRTGVLVGDDGWLFSTEEFDQPVGGDGEVQSKLALIKRVGDALAERDIALVVALLPDKSRVYSKFLGAYERPAGVERRYDDFRQELLADGIIAPDILGAMAAELAHGADVFLRTDTHWSVLGADGAARAIADAVDSLQLPSSNVKMVTATNEPKLHYGDLLKFLPLGPLADFGPPPDEITVATTTAESDGMDALFGDVVLDVALVGTSYSANPTWNFAGALAEHLQREVLNMAVEGKGPIVPMNEYLTSEEFKSSMPKVVIWEIPERFLPVNYDESSGVMP